MTFLINKTISLKVDTNGNIYFVNLKNNKIYDITIDKNNKLSIDDYNINAPCNQEFRTDIIKQKKLKIVGGDNSLKNNAIKKYVRKEVDMNDSDEEYDENRDVDEYYLKYHPENYEYELDSGEESEDLTEEEYVEFQNNTDLEIEEMEDSIPLYDCILYKGDLKFSTMVFKTTHRNVEPCYRLIIHDSGDIIFRVIGGREYKYKINSEEDLMLELFV